MAHRLSTRRQKYIRRQYEPPPTNSRMQHAPGMPYSKSFDNLEMASNPRVAELRQPRRGTAPNIYPPHSSPNSPTGKRRWEHLEVPDNSNFRSLQSSPQLGRHRFGGGADSAMSLPRLTTGGSGIGSAPGSRLGSVTSLRSGPGYPPSSASTMPHTPTPGRARKDSRAEYPPSSASTMPHTPTPGRARKDSRAEYPPSSASTMPPSSTKGDSQSSSNTEMTNSGQTADLIKDNSTEQQGKATSSNIGKKQNGTTRPGTQADTAGRRIRKIFKYIFVVVFIGIVAAIIYVLVTKLVPMNSDTVETTTQSPDARKKRSILQILEERY